MSSASSSTGAYDRRRSRKEQAAAEPCPSELTLEDLAGDGFRRGYVIEAFAADAAALELAFDFLHHVRRYKQLVGQRELLRTMAAEIDAIYFATSPTPVFEPTPAITQLVARIQNVIASGRCPLDLLSGLEAHVRDRLEGQYCRPFRQCPQYQQLCTAIRRRREIPLGEILVERRRTRFLEQYLRETQPPGAMGNLQLWVRVQTTFLPLIQTNLFSVALFEEIQATIREIYNAFFTESAPTLATIVPEPMRKDVLKKIMALQGEPFSPPRYASLFRPAQEKIWHWLQTDVYPKFQRSMLYVLLVVETENLESDLQLRRLSEHAAARQGAGDGVKSSRGDMKVSSIVIPVQEEAPRTTAKTHLEAILMPRAPASYGKTMVIDELTQAGIVGICVLRVDAAADSGRTTNYELEVRTKSSKGVPGFEEFLWNPRALSHALPLGYTSTSRLAEQHPKPCHHTFILPFEDTTLFGSCVTICRGVHPTGNSDGLVDGAGRMGLDAVWMPRYIVAFTISEQQIGRLPFFLADIGSLPADKLNEDVIRHRVLSLAVDNERTGSYSLQPQFESFAMGPRLSASPEPINAVFRLLSHQNVIALLGALMSGRAVILVSERITCLMSVGRALIDLLRPFDWPHLFLPFCPAKVANSLADRNALSSVEPFLIGVQARLSYSKSRDSPDNRYRIRNSIYSTTRASLQLDVIRTSSNRDEDLVFSPNILLSAPVIADIDANDVLVPERLDIPEFPQSAVRQLELNLKDAMTDGALTAGDSEMFSAITNPKLIEDIVEVSTANIPEPSPPTDHQSTLASSLNISDCIRLAVLMFLETLFGDTIFHFCSFFKTGADADKTSELIVLEVDSYLDEKIELGCREFFRQAFQTKAFHRFLRDQHRRFRLKDPR